MPILHIRFPSQYELASTFLRFQEHYESPEFRDKVFTHEEYFSWYARECGNMTYFSDWGGFNLPDYAFERFYRGEFDPLWDREARLLDLLRGLPRPFYVIGTFRDDELAHEAVHGLYYTDKRYREAVVSTLESISGDVLDSVRDSLLKRYNPAVCVDETNAFCLTGPADWMPKAPVGLIEPIVRGVFIECFGMEPTFENLAALTIYIEWESVLALQGVL